METSMPNSALQQAQASEAYACVVWSAFALAIYDYVVTLPSEAKVAWRRPFTATTALFLTTRWTMVAIVVTNAAPIAHVGHCVAVVWVSQVLSSVSFVQAAVFSALRIFALWRSNYVLAFLVLAPGLVPAVLNLYTTAFHSASAFVLCSGGAKTSMLPHAELIIAPRLAVVLTRDGLACLSPNVASDVSPAAQRARVGCAAVAVALPAPRRHFVLLPHARDERCRHPHV
ncbi:hypothetical protein PsYK624_065980 [Phanerochaete sordida]|uniref:DUF6533 domain-containing protein n=1 Tax=Phanerochaete sordida TaxID=48140 RepID=A0A9P3LE01_9APHY|nr:hypothetical protein PsYK624_065980 [Phanerochaete sordida]